MLTEEVPSDSDSDTDDAHEDDEEEQENGEAEQNVYHLDAEERKHMPRPGSTMHRRRRKARFGSSRVVTILDVSGLHEVSVGFCSCPGHEDQDMQLLRMGLYPATPSRPSTAFTFGLLDDLLLTNKECKTSIMNYYNKLRRRTDEAFPHSVSVSELQSRTSTDLTVD